MSCNKEKKIEDNKSLVYKNYSHPETIPFNVDRIFFNTSYDSLNAEGFRNNYPKLILRDNIATYFIKQYAICLKEYALNRYSGYKISKLDTLTKGVVLYSCGSIKLKNGVQSLIVLERYNYLLQFINNRDYLRLIFFNIKNNKLCSTVMVSNTDDFSNNAIYNRLFIGNDQSFILIDTSLKNMGIYDLCYNDNFSKLQRYLEIFGLLKNKRIKYNYSSFMIDNNGYVRFIDFDEDKLPDYLR